MLKILVSHVFYLFFIVDLACRISTWDGLAFRPREPPLEQTSPSETCVM